MIEHTTYCTECKKDFDVGEAEIIKCPDCETFYRTDSKPFHNDFRKGDIVSVFSTRQSKMVEAIFYRKSKLDKQFSVVYIPEEKQETHCLALPIEDQPKKQLTTTNWKYKGLTIYRDENGKFFIDFNGGIHPINFDGLPKTIQYDADTKIHEYTIHGKIGRDQE